MEAFDRHFGSLSFAPLRYGSGDMEEDWRMDTGGRSRHTLNRHVQSRLRNKKEKTDRKWKRVTVKRKRKKLT
jgi:hypothetical protein